MQISDRQNTIEAEDLRPLTLTIGDNVTALVNTSITIQCLTSGVPKPSVTWTKDGQELLSGGRYRIQDDNSLIISDASEEDNARYTCTADSAAGEDSSTSMVKIAGKKLTGFVLRLSTIRKMAFAWLFTSYNKSVILYEVIEF